MVRAAGTPLIQSTPAFGGDRRTVRLIACDLDGTLLGPDHELSQRTITAVRAAHAAGITVIAATGRSSTSATPRVRPAGVIETAVCSNGSLIHDVTTDLTTQRFAIDPAMVERLFQRLHDLDTSFACCWETDHGNGWDEAFGDIAFLHEDLGAQRSLERRPIATDQTTKIMVRHPDITQEDLRTHLVPRIVDPLTVSTSGVQFVEITGTGVNKSTGIAHLCQLWSIDPSEVITFGDNHNDAAMLEWAGHGVAMGNASAEALDMADEVIGTNTDDAVALWIERLLEDSTP